MANNVKYESYCELCLDKCGRIFSKLVSRLLQVEKFRKFRTKRFCIVSSCSCQLELVYMIYKNEVRSHQIDYIQVSNQVENYPKPGIKYFT